MASALVLSLLATVLPSRALAQTMPSDASVVIARGGQWLCEAPLEEYASSGALMVGARAYAGCIGARYRWDADSASFWLEKANVPVDDMARGRIRVVFHLGAPTAEVYIGDQLADIYNVSDMGLQPYEQGGPGGANMAPLRFVNDVFGFGTAWLGPYNQVRTTIGDGDLAAAPAWDRAVLPSLLGLRDSYGYPAAPPGGWTILPSTVKAFRDFGPVARDLQDRAVAGGVPHRLDWANLRMVYLDAWNGTPVMEVSRKQGRSVLTLWWHSWKAVKDEIHDLKATSNSWEGASGFFSLVSVAGTAVATVAAAEWTVPGALLSILFGSAYLYTTQSVKVRLNDLEACLDEASHYADQEHVAFSMGLRSDPNGTVTCLDHFEQP